MERITKTELAKVYNVAEKTISRWSKAGVDVWSPIEVYNHVGSLSRAPEKMRSKPEAVKRFEELTNQKIADSGDGGDDDDDDDGAAGESVAARTAREKLRKLTAEASRAEFLLAQSKRELVSLADDVAPAQTQAITEFCEEVEAMFPELGDLCDRLTGNEIMAKGLDLFYALRDRFHERMQKIIEEDLAA